MARKRSFFVVAGLILAAMACSLPGADEEPTAIAVPPTQEPVTIVVTATLEAEPTATVAEAEPTGALATANQNVNACGGRTHSM
jgi:hypothetical protein